MRKILLAALFLLPVQAHALPCLVVHVHDGDTFTCSTKQRVRLFGADAPEIGQAYGADAAAKMSGFILGKTVDIEPPAGHTVFSHSYDRIVGRVSVNCADIGAAMVETGNAWVADAYHPPASYDALQARAQAEHEGLWANPSPVAPWVWRKHQ